MKPDVVVDVGNSRMKWGLCANGAIADTLATTAEDPLAWRRKLRIWERDESETSWAVASVDPERRDAFVAWLKQVKAPYMILADKNQLPIQIHVEEPRKVGLDRLLDAVAANHQVARPTTKIIIDAGSAVTVDWVDAEGIFRGGAIFPGLQLMGNALHDYTAKLPLVEQFIADPPLPGLNTVTAIHAGVYWAVAGGIQTLVRRLTGVAGTRRCKVFLTGGDAALLAPALDSDVIVWPEMTLEGIRIAAEAQP